MKRGRDPASQNDAIKIDSSGFAYILGGNSISKLNQTGDRFIYKQLWTELSDCFGMVLDTTHNIYVASEKDMDFSEVVMRIEEGISLRMSDEEVESLEVISDTVRFIWRRIILYSR